MAELVLRIAQTRRVGGGGELEMHAEDLTALGIGDGGVVLLVGRHVTAARGRAARPDSPLARGVAIVDPLVAANAGVGEGETVRARAAEAETARRLELHAVDALPPGATLGVLREAILGLALVGGDRIQVRVADVLRADLLARKSEPSGAVVVGEETEIVLDGGREEIAYERAVGYGQIGGLAGELGRVRELVELPLRHPELFEHLGIDAPRGILLHGPPGCGKTLIARAIAHESEASFFPVSGPEIIHHFYGESEAHLRNLFQEAAHAAPSIVFLDEIDAIAPRRDKVSGEVEKRLVAQLLALMDGLTQREKVLVVAATNLPHALDPALRRPGRFDREIAIPPPDRSGRRQILEIHSRRMPLAEDVDLDALADATHGYVGADLAALCREAAMARLRRGIGRAEDAADWLARHELAELDVGQVDFLAALLAVGPSALRELVVDLPRISWDDVGGLGEAKAVLQEAVEWPLRHRELFEEMSLRPSRGLLLTGPPGSGKTLMAQAVAAASRAHFIVVRGAELYSRYVGESEKSLREIFQKARMSAPCVLFFDEIDGLLPRRGGTSTSEVGERLLGHLLAELDGVEDLRDVLVLAATNRPDRLDPALTRPGRFDRRIELPLPSREDRRQIFEIHLRGRARGEDVDAGVLADLAEGLTGAEIAEVCRRAAFTTIRRILNEESPERLTQEDLRQALREIEKQRASGAG